MALNAGFRLGPYEILSPIGSGGMGEVYRARDTRLDRDVAIKVIPAGARSIPDRIPRFEREARAVAALNHPNILALHDVGNQDSIVYAVTELLEGETLRARLEATGRLSPLKAIDCAIQIARGLAAAHERGIVHRDLKPENLFMTRDGRVKILDFGLAQQDVAASSAVESGTTRFTTSPGVVLGTSGYMSPEQVLGQPATPRSDLFALGVVVYEMLTGSPPFRRASLTDTATATLREDPPPLGLAVPSLPAALVKILERCLDKRADDRPSSARDLALFLDAISAQSKESSNAPTLGAAEARRVRTRILVLSCGLLILLSAVTWGFVRVMADRAVSATIDADLASAERHVLRVHRARLAALTLTARLVASFPELKALFETRDAATIRDFLLSYQQRNPDVALLIAVGPDGRAIARTDNVTAVSVDDESISAISSTEGKPTIILLRGRPFHAAAAVAEAGGNIFGHVVGALPVDDTFAVDLRDATQDEVLLLSKSELLASTLRGPQTPWRSLDDWRASRHPDRPTEAEIGVQRFAAREVVLSEQPAVAAVVLTSRDEATEPFRRIQGGVVVLGVLCAAVAAGGSLWIARTLMSKL